MEKMTFKCGYVQKRINTFLKKVPENEQKKYESGEEKKRRKRLRKVREVM